MNLVVIKKDAGTREQFFVIKSNGIIRSAQKKRPVSSDEIEEQTGSSKGSQPGHNEINSEYIGSLVMDELKI